MLLTIYHRISFANTYGGYLIVGARAGKTGRLLGLPQRFLYAARAIDPAGNVSILSCPSLEVLGRDGMPLVPPAVHSSPQTALAVSPSSHAVNSSRSKGAPYGPGFVDSGLQLTAIAMYSNRVQPPL